MQKNTIYFLAALGIAALSTPADASTSVATVPDGMMQFSLNQGSTTYLSLPLTNESTYTGTVAAVASNTISVDDSPAPFTTSLAAPSAPYFVKFLTGNEAGRVLLIKANTSSTLTVDTTDHTTGNAVALNTTGFDVESGDAFEIFTGDTLASIFGAGTSNSPLLLTGGARQAASDEVALYTTVGAPATSFYFNTTAGYWETVGGTANVNNTIIYPYSAFSVTRRRGHGDTTLELLGRVTPVGASTKTVGLGSVYTSSHYASDIKLSQLKFGTNWKTGNNAAQADTLSVWNAAKGRFDIYFQKPDSTWRKSGDAMTDQSNFSIPAGTVTTIDKREVVTGAQSFLVSAMPYTL